MGKFSSLQSIPAHACTSQFECLVRTVSFLQDSLDSRVSAACPPTGCTLVRLEQPPILSAYGVTRKLPRCRHRIEMLLRAIQVVARHSTSATCSFTGITS